MTTARERAAIDEHLTALQGAEQPFALVLGVGQLRPAQLAECVDWLLANDRFRPADRYALYRVDAQGRVTSRIVSERDPTRLASPRFHLALGSATFNGVALRYLSGYGRGGVVQTVTQIPNRIDPRNLIFLWRLTELLRETHQASTMYHNGFVFDATRVDCHGQGRAVDFAGIEGTGFRVTVQHNWHGQPVTLRNAWRDPRTGRQHAAGTQLADWPGHGFTDTYFRLDPTQNPNLDPSLEPDRARRLFSDVYALARQVMTDTSDPTRPSVIGGASAIMTCDHPTSSPGAPNGREAHFNHMHIQIGPTMTEAEP